MLFKNRTILYGAKAYTGRVMVDDERPHVTNYQKRIIAKQHGLYRILKVVEIAFFYVAEKSVFAVMQNQETLLVQENLGQLQALLDPQLFFRANRQYLINWLHISGYQKRSSSRLRIKVKGVDAKHTIVVNTETLSDFKNWIKRRTVKNEIDDT